MVKQTLLIFSFCLFFLFGCVPKSIVRPYSDTSTSYAQDFKQHLDSNAKLIKSWYNYTVELSQDRKYIVKLYYPEKKTMTSRKEYLNSDLTILAGKSSNYTDDGLLLSEGLYAQNKRFGEWKEYNRTNGTLSRKGDYKLGDKEGIWTEYDSLGTVVATYTYEENKKNGPYQIFKEGKLYESGKFLNDDVVNTKMVTEGTESLFASQFKLVEKMPEYPGCDPSMDEEERKQCSQNAMLQFIYSNIKYPPKARQLNVQGAAVIRFVVEKDGSINEIEALRGICAPIEEECIRIIKMMPKWKPGLQDGKAVRVYFNLPVMFKLE